MKTPMYQFSAPVYVRTLQNLSAILNKAAAHAEARKIDPMVLLASRMYPDMFPLLRQVLIACDFAKGSVARLCGQEPPSWEDTEKTIDDLKARIARTIEFVQSFKPEQFEGADERTVELKIRGEVKRMPGLTYLTAMALPNFYFHATTAYDLLRKDGVEVGKADFIGRG